MGNPELAPSSAVYEAILNKLRELYTVLGVLFAHGARSEETARLAVQEGLKFENSMLSRTAWPLHDLRYPIGEGLEDMAEMVQHWPWLNSQLRWIVILRLPSEDQDEVDSKIQPLPNPTAKHRYILPKQYVVGYFDNQTGNFTSGV